jgi:DNA-binding SARP family transcriptional activator
MTVAMEFGLLGPLMVRCNHADVTVSRSRERTVLAALLLRANQVVLVADLAEALWGGVPPPSAEMTARNYVKRLRRLLGEADGRIGTAPGGYRISVEPGELDVARFEQLAASARAAARAGRWEQVSRQAGAALSLWRGDPLEDTGAALSEREAPRLTEMRLQLLEARLDADVRCGGHARVIPELRRLVRVHPLRERLHATLMLALYQDGQQADAVAAYRSVRQVLVTELGVEPGPGLRELHQQILSADPSLTITRPEPAAVDPVRVTPQDLPPTVPGFTGRTAELEELTRVLDQASTGTPGTVLISAIRGTAGVGKTALALHWAHQVSGRFPDGQLHVNLRGFAPFGSPVTPAEAVRGFLDALGVPPERIPPAPAAQAGLYRSLLADRKMLIVLDNARDEEQVRPLLPASPASLVLVTSRNQLTGLAAANGARLISLDILTHDEAVRLFTGRLGEERAAAEPGAADQIAALCAYLPLALAIAAAQAAARPRFALMQLAAELREAADRLDALDAGDPAASIRSVFSWSYQQLSPPAARMFRLLGLHPGPDISVPAAASLAAVGEPLARRLLRELTRDCLIIEHAPGRYAFHDLLRAYAASQARDYDPEPDRDAAVGRIIDHYLHSASHSRLLLRRPVQESLALAPPGPGAHPERPADHRQALAWFDAEHPVLLATAALASETGTDRRAWQLPCAMAEYFRTRGYAHEQATVMASALAAATRLDDTRGQAMSLRRLGLACCLTGDYDQARAHLEDCLPLYRRLGDRHGEAVVQQNLWNVADAQDRYVDALGHVEQARALFQAIGHELAEAETLGSSAWFHALLGDYQRARELCEQALALSAKLGGGSFEHAIRDTLGYIELHLGNFAQAAVQFEAALREAGCHSDALVEALILIHLGDARYAAGELPQARHAWQQALAIYGDIQHPNVGKVRDKLAGRVQGYYGS